MGNQARLTGHGLCFNNGMNMTMAFELTKLLRFFQRFSIEKTGITNRPPLPSLKIPDAVRPRTNRVSLGAPEQRAVKLGLFLQWRGVNLGRTAPFFDRDVRGLWRLPGAGAGASANAGSSVGQHAILQSLLRMSPCL